MSKPKKPENMANAQLTQDCIEARKHGLSYGMYQLYVEMGKLERVDVKELYRKQREEADKQQKGEQDANQK